MVGRFFLAKEIPKGHVPLHASAIGGLSFLTRTMRDHGPTWNRERPLIGAGYRMD